MFQVSFVWWIPGVKIVFSNLVKHFELLSSRIGFMNSLIGCFAHHSCPSNSIYHCNLSLKLHVLHLLADMMLFLCWMNFLLHCILSIRLHCIAVVDLWSLSATSNDMYISWGASRSGMPSFYNKLSHLFVIQKFHIWLVKISVDTPCFGSC